MIVLCVLVSAVTRLTTFWVDEHAAYPHANSGFWAHMLLRANPAWKLTLEGSLPVDRGPYVIVANHQSQLDVFAIYLIRHHFKWISKASMLWVPFIGWNIRLCRYIALTRGDKESIATCMETAADWIRRGVSVLFFPEGTRSPDGTVRPFKLGAFRLAAETGALLLPITISGTDRVLPKGGWLFVEQSHIRVHVGSPIAAPKPDQIETVAELIRTQIAAKKAELDLLR